MMKRNSTIVTVLIGLFICGGALFTLVKADRSPIQYFANHQMNYAVPKERTVASREPEKDQPEKITQMQTPKQRKQEPKKTEPKDPRDNETPAEDPGTDDSGRDTPGGEGGNPDGGEGGEPQPKAPKLVALSCSWAGSDSLRYGQSADLSAITVQGTYDNGSTETIPIENCTINGFDSAKLGRSSCSVLYYGLSARVSYRIINWEKELTCSAWSKADDYRYNDRFHKSDMSVQVIMADGTRRNLSTSKFSVSGVNTKDVGTHTATITYNGMSTTKSYTVRNYPKKLTSTVRKFVVRGHVSWNEIMEGQRVTLTMADGTKRVLNRKDYDVSGYQVSESGKHSVTITAEGLSLTIPYQVYMDILRVNFKGIGSTYHSDTYFHSKKTITSAEDLGIPEIYTQANGVDRYQLVGVYRNTGCTKKLEYPKTYEPKKEFQINRDSMSWNTTNLYAKYKLLDPKKDPDAEAGGGERNDPKPDPGTDSRRESADDSTVRKQDGEPGEDKSVGKQDGEPGDDKSIREQDGKPGDTTDDRGDGGVTDERGQSDREQGGTNV